LANRSCTYGKEKNLEKNQKQRRGRRFPGKGIHSWGRGQKEVMSGVAEGSSGVNWEPGDRGECWQLSEGGGKKRGLVGIGGKSFKNKHTGVLSNAGNFDFDKSKETKWHGNKTLGKRIKKRIISIMHFQIRRKSNEAWGIKKTPLGSHAKQTMALRGQYYRRTRYIMSKTEKINQSSKKSEGRARERMPRQKNENRKKSAEPLGKKRWTGEQKKNCIPSRPKERIIKASSYEKIDGREEKKNED